MEHIYHKQVGKAELSYSRCFLVDDWAFFSSMTYSWEFGKERRQLRVIGSTCCIAQSLHRPLLPSEVQYLLKKFSRTFGLDSIADLTTEQNQDAPLPSILEGRKQTGKSRVSNVPSDAWNSNDWSIQTDI